MSKESLRSKSSAISLPDLVSSLRKGEAFLISLPSEEGTNTLIADLSRIAVKLRQADHIPYNLSSLLLKTRNLAQALQALNKSLRNVPLQSPILINCCIDSPRWLAKPENRNAFVTKALSALRKAGRKSIWMVSKGSFSREELFFVQEYTSFFLDVSTVGDRLSASFLKARKNNFIEERTPYIFQVSASSIQLIPARLSIRPQEIHSSGPGETLPEEILETLPQAVIRFDLINGGVSANKKACSVLGFSQEEFVSLRVRNLLPEKSYFPGYRLLSLLRHKGRAAGEIDLRRKDGKVLRFSLDAVRLHGDEFVVMLENITEIKKQERRLYETSQGFRSLISDAPYPLAVFINKKLTFSNLSFAQSFAKVIKQDPNQISLSAFLGRTNATVLKELALLEETSDNRGNSVSLVREIAFNPSDSDTLCFELHASRVQYLGKTALQCLFVDITARSHSLKELQSTASLYREILEGSPDAVSLVRDGHFIFVNTSFLGMFGYASNDEILGKDSSSFHVGELGNVEGRKEDKSRSSMNRYEFDRKKADGSRISVEALSKIGMLGGTRTTITYYRDITARKESLDDIRQTVRAWESVRRITTPLGGILDPKELLHLSLSATIKELKADAGAMCLMNDEASELSLVSEYELTEKLRAAFAAQPVSEGIAAYVNKTLEPVILSAGDYPAYLPHKKLFVSEGLQTVVYIPLLGAHTLYAVLVVGWKKERTFDAKKQFLFELLRDELGGIVSRSVLFRRIKVSEDLYRTSLENISEIVYQLAPSGKLIFLSSGIERLVGHLPSEFHKTADLWRMLLHPDDRTKYSQRISNHAMDKNEFQMEYRILPKGKAAYRWVRDSIRYARDASGELISIHGTLTDITPQVEFESGLVKSEELKANVLESIQEGVVVLDTSLTYIDWNKAMEEIAGITRDSVISKDAFQATPTLFQEDTRPLLKRALAGESVSSQDILLLVDGQQKYIWIRYSPLRDSTGAIRGVAGIIADITGRKRLEREAKESEETLRNVIDAMGDGLMISDLQGKVWEMNREFSHITGYPRSEVLGLQFPYPWVVDEELVRFVKWIAALREKSYMRDFDMTWMRKDGRKVAISLNTTLLRNAVGDPVAMLNIARDISDRKRLSLELEWKNKQIELLNRIISKANETMDFPEMFDTIAREVLPLVNYDEINVAVLSEDRNTMTVIASVGPAAKTLPVGATVFTENTVSKIAIEQNRAIVINDLGAHESLAKQNQSILEGFNAQISIPFYLKEKVLGTFNVVSVNKNAFSGEELTFLQPIADQIGAMVDRVRLFQKVSEDSKYIHNLVNSIASVVYTIDTNYTITEANKAWREFAQILGLDTIADENAIIGRPLEEILPDRISWPTFRSVMQDLFDGKTDVYEEEFQRGREGIQKIFRLVITPMIIDGKVTGLVFTYTDITQIKTTEEQVRQRNKELVALNTIATSINTSLNLNEVLKVAAAQIRDIVGANVVLFYLREEHADRLLLAQSLGLSEEHAGKISNISNSGSVTGAAISGRQPLYITSGLLQDERVTLSGRKVFEELGLHSLGAIPLRSRERVLGALDVVFAGQHQFSEQEQQLLLLIGNQIGPAIENAQLYAEVQAQVQRITSLYELGKTLTGTLNTQALLQSVRYEVARALPLDLFSYALFDEFHHSLKTVYEFADGKETFHTGETNQKEQIVLSDSHYWAVVTDASPLRTTSNAGESMIAVPVKAKQKVIGILTAITKSEGVYSLAHLRLLESIANLTEIALEKARLYEDTITKSMEIEARNKELDDFTYVVSHDLKEPLISIEGYSKILLHDYRDGFDEDGKEYLSSVVQSTSRMKGLIGDLLTLSRLGRVADTSQTISSLQIVKEILHELRFTLEEKHTTVTAAPDLPEVRYNATQLSMVFRNLISNALKFNDKPDPTISIAVEDQPDCYVFSVADNGIGIEKQYFEKIFMIFQRLQRSEQYRGTGAGLTIVKKIVENHHGRIWVESNVGDGTSFYFTVPKYQN